MISGGNGLRIGDRPRVATHDLSDLAKKRHVPGRGLAARLQTRREAIERLETTVADVGRTRFEPCCHARCVPVRGGR